MLREIIITLTIVSLSIPVVTFAISIFIICFSDKKKLMKEINHRLPAFLVVETVLLVMAALIFNNLKACVL